MTPSLRGEWPMARWTAIGVAAFLLIIVPFALFGEAMDAWAVTTLRELAERPLLSAGLVVGLLGADIVLPVPSSVLSTLSGAVLGVVPGTIASFLGMTAGCGVGYLLGRVAGEGAVGRWIGEGELARLRAGTRRSGDWVLIVSRAVPVLAEASVVAAGMGAMPLKRFLVLTGASNLGISVVYAWVGARAVDVGSFLLAFAGAVLIPLIAIAVFGRTVDR